MVKTFATIAFVLASLVVADSAMAFGRHGCSSCSKGGGCPGGGCPGGGCPGGLGDVGIVMSGYSLP